jgi:hypothetical protein
MENKPATENVAAPVGSGKFETPTNNIGSKQRVALRPTWDDWQAAAATLIAATGSADAEALADKYAFLTCDHAASSYGIPVVVLPDGTALGPADSPWPGFGMIVQVANPHRIWQDPAVEALVAAAERAGYRILREQW